MFAFDRPFHADPTTPTGAARPAEIDWHDRTRILAAAHRARQRYPGAVGELVARELRDWAEFGYRLGGGLVSAVVDEIMSAPAEPAARPVAAA